MTHKQRMLADFERIKRIGQRVCAFGAGPVKKGSRGE